MRYRSTFVLKLLLVLLLVMLMGCSRKTTQVALYWPYDLWDGMNRLAFALEELGYELHSVDTDNGTLVARKWPSDVNRANQTGFDNRRPYELWFQFPVDPRMPIMIRELPPGPGLSGLSESKLQSVIDEIAAKFEQFGGVVEEVTLKD